MVSPRFSALDVLWVVLLSAACSNEVAIAPSGGGGSGAGGTASSTVSTTSSNGFGGGFGSGPSASTGTGAMTDACASAYIDLDTPQGVVHFDRSCPFGWEQQASRPVAYFNSGLAFTDSLVVSGCLDPASNVSSIRIRGNAVDTTQPSTSPGVVESYVDSMSTAWGSTQSLGQIVITKMTSKTGEIVEGSFSVEATANGQVVMLSGTFRACKIDDLHLP